MARMERRPSGGHVYAVVVEDVRQGNRWRKKVVKSFGNVSDPARTREAEQFAAALTAARELQGAGWTEQQVQDAFKVLLTGFLLGLLIAALTDTE